MTMEGTIRQPAVAGQFYQGETDSLGREVDHLLGSARIPERKGFVRALVSPHAGYMFSGGTAAHGYRFVSGEKYDAVVIVGPSHRDSFDGVTIYPGEGYRTPLGDVPVDSELRTALVQAEPRINVSALGHRLEHSVEVQLPFLQRVFGDLRFVPMVMGDQNRETCEMLASALTKACSCRCVLLVASTDLSHYHPYAEARKLDRIAVDDIREVDPDALLRHLETHQTEACGGGPVASVLKAARNLGASYSLILHQCNSGDIVPQKENVVGYLSAAILQSNECRRSGCAAVPSQLHRQLQQQ